MDDEIEEGMVVDEDPNPLPSHRLPESRAAGKFPYELLRESKSSVEDIVAKILAIKRHSLPKSQLRELVTQIFLHFVTLRQVMRPHEVPPHIAIVSRLGSIWPYVHCL